MPGVVTASPGWWKNLSAGARGVPGVCDDGVTEVCDEGNKAVITVYNNSLCTPDVSVNGDEIASDLGILDQVSVEVDAGTHDVTTNLSLITTCTELDWEVEVACGDSIMLTFE